MKKILENKAQVYEFAAQNHAIDSVEFYELSQDHIKALLQGKFVVTHNDENTLVLQIEKEPNKNPTTLADLL